MGQSLPRYILMECRIEREDAESSKPVFSKTNTTYRLTLPPTKTEAFVLNRIHILQFTTLKPSHQFILRPITACKQHDPAFPNQRNDPLLISLTYPPSTHILLIRK